MISTPSPPPLLGETLTSQLAPARYGCTVNSTVSERGFAPIDVMATDGAVAAWTVPVPGGLSPSSLFAVTVTDLRLVAVTVARRVLPSTVASTLPAPSRTV